MCDCFDEHGIPLLSASGLTVNRGGEVLSRLVKWEETAARMPLRSVSGR
jgi:hypothetical protein